MSQPIKNQPHMNPYDYHKYLINEYVLKKPGDTKKLHEIDKSKWKTDKDVIYENMKFIWNEDEMPATWEARLAKKYYDKLFKEYCICDLSRFKENKIANRFRVEKEVVTGKGQFVCGEKSCSEKDSLRTWEVNFSYVEDGNKKNTLVKIRLCPSCSDKLNHHTMKREIKRLKRNRMKRKSAKRQNSSTEVIENATTSEEARPKTPEGSEEEEEEEDSPRRQPAKLVEDENLWKKSEESELKGRDEEFDEYLADLLL